MKSRKKFAKIGKPCGSPSKHDHCHFEPRGILLIRQIAIDRQKHVELRSRKPQKRAVPDVFPTELFHSLDVVVVQIAEQPPVNAFINQQTSFAERQNASFGFLQ